jgi:hypothetical protein
MAPCFVLALGVELKGYCEKLTRLQRNHHGGIFTKLIDEVNGSISEISRGSFCPSSLGMLSRILAMRCRNA